MLALVKLIPPLCLFDSDLLEHLSDRIKLCVEFPPSSQLCVDCISLLIYLVFGQSIYQLVKLFWICVSELIDLTVDECELQLQFVEQIRDLDCFSVGYF